MKRTVLLLMTFFLTAALISCAGSQAFNRGERYSHSGEWDLAVKEYREANRKEPKDIEYRSALIRAEETASNQHYKKAKSFLKERKLDQAITELQQAIYLNPTNAAIQGALRSVLDMKQAEEHYRAALQHWKHPAIHYKILAAGRNDPEAAFALFEKRAQRRQVIFTRLQDDRLNIVPAERARQFRFESGNDICKDSSRPSIGCIDLDLFSGLGVFYPDGKHEITDQRHHKWRRAGHSGWLPAGQVAVGVVFTNKTETR